MNTVILGKNGTNRENAVSLLVQALSPAKEFFNLQFFGFYERGEFFDSRFSRHTPPPGFFIKLKGPSKNFNFKNSCSMFSIVCGTRFLEYTGFYRCPKEILNFTDNVEVTDK
jgi:hypothetical protein